MSHDVSPGGTGTIEDLNVCINILSTWPGDLYVTLTHGSTTVVLLNRPGNPFGSCDVPDIYLYLDDQGSEPAEDVCPPLPLNGIYQPHEPLSVFAGESISGTWTLTVWDQAAGFPQPDTNSLTGFSMSPTFQP